MEQIGNEIKKVIQAGMGAVATGVEKTQGAIDQWAQKGEPIYQQAKTAVTEKAKKICKAVQQCPLRDMLCCRPRSEKIIRELELLSPEELDAVRQALKEMDDARPDQKAAPSKMEESEKE